MNFDEILEGAYREMAAQRFTPVEKCPKCYASGAVSDYSCYPFGTTGSIPKRPCDKCGGSGEVRKW